MAQGPQEPPVFGNIARTESPSPLPKLPRLFRSRIPGAVPGRGLWRILWQCHKATSHSESSRQTTKKEVFFNIALVVRPSGPARARRGRHRAGARLPSCNESDDMFLRPPLPGCRPVARTLGHFAQARQENVRRSASRALKRAHAAWVGPFRDLRLVRFGACCCGASDGHDRTSHSTPRSSTGDQITMGDHDAKCVVFTGR